MRQPTAKARAAAPKKHRGDFVPPHYVLKLMHESGIAVTEAAERLGTKATTLYRAKRMNAVAKHFEVAARGLLYEMGLLSPEPEAPAERTTQLDTAILAPASDGVVSFLVAVPADKAEVMRAAIRAMGGKIYVQQD